MASFTQIRNSDLVKSHYPVKGSRVYRLKRPWSHGRGYVVIAGVTVLILLSLGTIYLHQALTKAIAAVLRFK